MPRLPSPQPRIFPQPQRPMSPQARQMSPSPMDAGGSYSSLLPLLNGTMGQQRPMSPQPRMPSPQPMRPYSPAPFNQGNSSSSSYEDDDNYSYPFVRSDARYAAGGHVPARSLRDLTEMFNSQSAPDYESGMYQ
jgi:hypothetical protein